MKEPCVLPLDKAYLEKQGGEYNLVDWYLDVLCKYKDKLLDITRYVIAEAWLSKAKFVDKLVCWDSKQFTGLNDRQARDLKKLDFAFNASLASVNIAKVMRQRYYPSLSIGLLKAYLNNTYMLKRIFSKSGMKPNRTLMLNLSKNSLA